MDNSSNKTLSLAAAIEAILFYTAEPMSYRKLAILTKTDATMVREAAKQLSERLAQSESGIRLIEQDNEIALGTAPAASALIEEITREEITKELSKAAVETLSIICYKGPLTRSDIDYIRGVNSTFILRNLLVRGIVEKLENPRDARAALYGATFAALEYMGVTRKEELPQYEEIQAQLEAFASARFTEDGESEQLVEKTTEEDMSLHDASLGDDMTDSKAELCDSDGDGILTREECDPDFKQGELSESPESTNLEADIAEEDLMAPAFDDSAIAVHNAEDDHAA
ncbi:MAG TPA: SMC-Scp complex subunit ScpB [Candidatus Paceibacterota bacterium]|nr:SMC-Scp complex subunit ScpB [Candidatus Paceibacterota bacterium]